MTRLSGRALPLKMEKQKKASTPSLPRGSMEGSTSTAQVPAGSLDHTVLVCQAASLIDGWREGWRRRVKGGKADHALEESQILLFKEVDLSRRRAVALATLPCKPKIYALYRKPRKEAIKTSVVSWHATSVSCWAKVQNKEPVT